MLNNCRGKTTERGRTASLSPSKVCEICMKLCETLYDTLCGDLYAIFVCNLYEIFVWCYQTGYPGIVVSSVTGTNGYTYYVYSCYLIIKRLANVPIPMSLSNHTIGVLPTRHPCLGLAPC